MTNYSSIVFWYKFFTFLIIFRYYCSLTSRYYSPFNRFNIGLICSPLFRSSSFWSKKIKKLGCPRSCNIFRRLSSRRNFYRFYSICEMFKTFFFFCFCKAIVSYNFICYSKIFIFHFHIYQIYGRYVGI